MADQRGARPTRGKTERESKSRTIGPVVYKDEKKTAGGPQATSGPTVAKQGGSQGGALPSAPVQASQPPLVREKSVKPPPAMLDLQPALLVSVLPPSATAATPPNPPIDDDEKSVGSKGEMEFGSPADSVASSGGGQATGNVKVCVRFRPQNSVERESGGVWTVELADQAVKVKDPGSFHPPHTFNFDRVFTPDGSQRDVYEFVGRPLVADVLNGFNCSLLTYGQTGSGKTHTMMGEDGEQAGVIPRIVEDVFKYMEAAPSSCEFSLKVSYVEIYLERICDLLNPENTDLKVRENDVRGLYLEGVEESYVGSREEMYDLMRRGAANRTVASTRMNADSSRSHSVFIITTEQVDQNAGVKKKGQMYLVDLAGSETVSKTNASGQVLQEAKTINKSLSALGNVIKALVEKHPHIPYRDSKLTRLLQDALGGNSKTSLIITCSGSSYNVTETLSTLRFGTRAKSIRNKPKVNQERSLAEYKRLLEVAAAKEADLENIIRRLEARVQELLSQRMPSPRGDAAARKSAGDGVGPVSHEEPEGEEEGEQLSAADIIAGELASMVSVLQPLAAEVRDELDSEQDRKRHGELDSLLTLLSEAAASKQSSVLSSGMLRLFQVLKEIVIEKLEVLKTQSRALERAQEAASDRDKMTQEVQRELVELRVANEQLRASNQALVTQAEQSAAQASQIHGRMLEEKGRADLLQTQVAQLESDLKRKEYELKEQTLVSTQLRQTLETLAMSSASASSLMSMSTVASATQAGETGRKVTGKTREEMLEGDLKDLMTRFIDMRSRFEEERSAVQQLTELLDEAKTSDGGSDSDAAHARLAATVVDLRKALDRKSIELQDKAALVESLMVAKETMRQQLNIRDEHITHLESIMKELQGKIREQVTMEMTLADTRFGLVTKEVGKEVRGHWGVTPATPAGHVRHDSEDSSATEEDEDSPKAAGRRVPSVRISSRPRIDIISPNTPKALSSTSGSHSGSFTPKTPGGAGSGLSSWLGGEGGSQAAEVGHHHAQSSFGGWVTDWLGGGGSKAATPPVERRSSLKKVIRGGQS